MFGWMAQRLLGGDTTANRDRIEGYKQLLRRFGYEPWHWVRYTMYHECFRLIEGLGPETLDACEISAGNEWRKLPFRSYSELNFPEFDLCSQVLDRQFDLIIADNVFEHLPYPYRAARNVLEMLKPGAAFLNITPFMIRVHEVPIDCSRWTVDGMAYFLEDCGFERQSMITGSWGNRACVKGNLSRWQRVGFYSPMKNEPQYPVQVWALARKPSAA